MACLTKIRYGEMRYHMDAVVNEEGVRCGGCAAGRTDGGAEAAPVPPARASGEGGDTSSAGEFIRRATGEDVERHKPLEMSQKTPDYHSPVAKIAELNLPMKLVKIERLF